MTLPSPYRLSPAKILNDAFAGLFLSVQIEALLDRVEGAR